MEPSRDGDAVVDVLDVLLRDGAMLQADVIITVADIPLIGINLRAAIAGMATMRDHGFFEDWDAATRAQEVGEQRAASRRGKFVPREESGTHGDADATLPSKRPEAPRQSDRRRSPPSARPDRSKRPRQSDSWRDEESGRPPVADRPGDPDRSSVSKRPRGSERPRELNVDVGERSEERRDGDHTDEEVESMSVDEGADSSDAPEDGETEAAETEDAETGDADAGDADSDDAETGDAEGTEPDDDAPASDS